jgi:hypothetical protein
MRLRNQRGCLRCTRRKTGPPCWEFLWRENDADGNRTRRTAVIGTLEQFPTRDLAQAGILKTVPALPAPPLEVVPYKLPSLP